MIKTIVQELKGDQEFKYEVVKDQHLQLILLASQKSVANIEVKLVGRNSNADILGVIVSRGNDEITIHTLQDHIAPQTRSNLLIKTALLGRSLFNYQGFIKVEKNAQQTDAYQRNENLMLSPEAKAESKPALEILANDVRCTHSATIGKVDPEQLFYLESRGVMSKEAQLLIVQGFLFSVVDKVHDAATKTRLTKKLTTYLQYL